MSLVPDVCTNVADWKLSKKTHKPFHDTNWNKASFKLNKTLDGLQQVRQLETHQNPSSNSFLHVCEMYQLPTTAKKKQPPTYRTTEHWPWNHSPKKTRVHPCFFLTTRWVSLGHVSVNSFASTGHWSAPHREKRRGFTYGNLWKWNSPKGNLRNLTKKHLQMVEVLRTLRLLVVFWDFLFNLPGKAPTLNSKSLVVISWWLCG